MPKDVWEFKKEEIRNLEASVRSRDTDAASHTERELIEAGLN
jgi:hypothetical protein